MDEFPQEVFPGVLMLCDFAVTGTLLLGCFSSANPGPLNKSDQHSSTFADFVNENQPHQFIKKVVSKCKAIGYTCKTKREIC